MTATQNDNIVHGDNLVFQFKAKLTLGHENDQIDFSFSSQSNQCRAITLTGANGANVLRTVVLVSDTVQETAPTHHQHGED